MGLDLGTKLGRYEILSPVGAGGMGEVYRAKDTRLKREVAIKVLPDSTARDPEALSRFQREAEAVAALSHPNILAIHDVGREGKTSFLVSELLEGETLRERIERAAIPWRKAVELAVAIADGLAAAHAKEIVHRDLKPANVFLTDDGVVKILDFGLARVPKSAQPQEHTLTLDTQPGAVLGTACYMSPEQIRGKPTDARSDIFALGCVLFEMVTGERAFNGETSADVTTAILTHEPSSVSESVSDVVPELGRTIGRCLEKGPRRRFQSSDDLAFTLRNILAGSGQSRIVGAATDSSSFAGDKPSIAVLPFENMSADPENEYFSDGISEEIISALSKLKGLRVAARTSAFSFKGKQAEVKEIGQKLNVGTVLEGSVRKSGDRVRIMAELIQVADGERLWSERFDRKLEDVFAVQDEIAQAIVDELRVKLVSGSDGPLVQRETTNMEAYNLYLKGRHHWGMMTPEGFQAARECFEQAAKIDPQYAAPHAGIADTYVIAAFWGGISAGEAYPKARQWAEAALAINDSEAEALGVLGSVHTFYDLDWSEAERRFKQALEIDPKNANILSSYGKFLTVRHRDDESVAAHRRAHAIDPLSNIVTNHYGQALNWAVRHDESIEVFLESAARDPHDFYPHYGLGWAYREKLMFAESLAHLRQSVELSNSDPWITSCLGLTLYRFGDRAEAIRLFEEVRTKSETRPTWPFVFVLIHMIQGEYDEAVRWLEISRDTHGTVFAWINAALRSNRSLNLGMDPRIERILAEAGIP